MISVAATVAVRSRFVFCAFATARSPNCAVLVAVIDELYRTVLRPLLDPMSRAFWDGRDLTGRRRYHYFSNGLYRHGALGRFIGFAHILARLYRIDLRALLLGSAGDPDRRKALARLDHLFRSPFARALTGIPALLFSLGIPPRQRALLAEGEPSLGEVLLDRLRRLIEKHPIETNYFAWQALQRRYPGPGNSCLPPYLQERHFDRMRAGVSAVAPAHANVRSYLESLPTVTSTPSSSSTPRTGWRRRKSARCGRRSTAA